MKFTVEAKCTPIRDMLAMSESEIGGHAAYNNFRIALNHAQDEFQDADLGNFSVVEVEGYKCVVHGQRNGKTFDLDDASIFPFDETKAYPTQGLEWAMQFRRTYD